MQQQFFPAVLALAALAAPTLAQQGADAPLVANQEVDAYAIAEQVYAQARNTTDSYARSSAMTRAAELFGNFTRRFPRSVNKEKALYLQAICLTEAGNSESANIKLGELANTCHGEYAAAAAYKLGTQAAERSMWDKAIGYFQITGRETKRAELKNDAVYRLGRAQLQAGQRKDAEASFRSLQVLRGVAPAIANSSLLAIAQMKTEDGNDTEAYSLFRNLLDKNGLDNNMRGTATLQAARLAARLGKTEESQELYSRLTRIAGMEKYAAEAHMESMLALYKDKRYQDVVSSPATKIAPLEDKAKEARRCVIIGQSFMELKQYERAIPWFENAEKAQPATPLAADAGYRRLICAQQIRRDFFTQAEKYLITYATPGSPTAGLPCIDLVRLMYADRMMMAQPAVASRQFEALNMEQLPQAVRADAEYKKAWCASQSDQYDPLPTLDHFIATYPEDKRFPDALALRGQALAKQNKTGQALADFDRVIKDYPDSEAAAVSWQRAAQTCGTADSARMIKYYEGLIAYYEKAVKRGIKNKPAAIAEAHYNIACALYETTPDKAIAHFRDARTLNAEQYAPLVDLRLVQCYFKMKDAAGLKEALVTLEGTNPGSYKALPPAILRWCGWSCFQARDYAAANKYLSDALVREPSEKYTDEQGQEQTRPKVEPIVWKTLARARLELGQNEATEKRFRQANELYAGGLEAASHYVSMENQPYRKAEGMRDKALLLIRLKRCEEARKLSEEAIALGVDGPIKSSLFITLGDACYADGKFSDAAKYYGRTANVVSDKELKPTALYKIASALKRCGKAGEAAQYEQSLETEFPDWKPDSSVQLLMNAAAAHTPVPTEAGVSATAESAQ